MPIDSGFYIEYCQAIVQLCPHRFPNRPSIQTLDMDTASESGSSEAALTGIFESWTDPTQRCYSLNFLLTSEASIKILTAEQSMNMSNSCELQTKCCGSKAQWLNFALGFAGITSSGESQ